MLSVAVHLTTIENKLTRERRELHFFKLFNRHLGISRGAFNSTNIAHCELIDCTVFSCNIKVLLNNSKMSDEIPRYLLHVSAYIKITLHVYKFRPKATNPPSWHWLFLSCQLHTYQLPILMTFDLYLKPKTSCSVWIRCLCYGCINTRSESVVIGDCLN